jgi:enolase
MAQIAKIRAREILDSRGLPTIEGILTLSTGAEVRAQAASGESLGKHEGLELRDKDLRYDGMGVSKAITFVNDLIGPKLTNVGVDKYFEIDDWLLKADGTKNQSKLGVNTIIIVSQLIWKGAAMAAGIPIYQFINNQYSVASKTNTVVPKIPSPIFNMINGGKHGSTNLDFQEFHVIPPTSISFAIAVVQDFF